MCSTFGVSKVFQDVIMMFPFISISWVSQNLPKPTFEGSAYHRNLAIVVAYDVCSGRFLRFVALTAVAAPITRRAVPTYRRTFWNKLMRFLGVNSLKVYLIKLSFSISGDHGLWVPRQFFVVPKSRCCLSSDIWVVCWIEAFSASFGGGVGGVL